MATPQDNPVVLGRLRKASWFAFLCLALLQLAVAGHQFEHHAEFSADTCHVCVQLDRIDDTTVDSLANQPALVSAPAAFLTFSAAFAGATFFRHFDTRAPPVV